MAVEVREFAIVWQKVLPGFLRGQFLTFSATDQKGNHIPETNHWFEGTITSLVKTLTMSTSSGRYRMLPTINSFFPNINVQTVVKKCRY